MAVRQGRRDSRPLPRHQAIPRPHARARAARDGSDPPDPCTLPTRDFRSLRSRLWRQARPAAGAARTHGACAHFRARRCTARLEFAPGDRQACRMRARRPDDMREPRSRAGRGIPVSGEVSGSSPNGLRRQACVSSRRCARRQ
jgi:hypothetical protein